MRVCIGCCRGSLRQRSAKRHLRYLRVAHCQQCPLPYQHPFDVYNPRRRESGAGFVKTREASSSFRRHALGSALQAESLVAVRCCLLLYSDCCILGTMSTRGASGECGKCTRPIKVPIGVQHLKSHNKSRFSSASSALDEDREIGRSGRGDLPSGGHGGPDCGPCGSPRGEQASWVRPHVCIQERKQITHIDKVEISGALQCNLARWRLPAYRGALFSDRGNYSFTGSWRPAGRGSNDGPLELRLFLTVHPRPGRCGAVTCRITDAVAVICLSYCP
jgi:hypothetical protein